MPNPDGESATATAACGFCGSEQDGGRLLLSGRPRARTLGRPTPFVCSDCVSRSAAVADDSPKMAVCTFCGRTGPRALQGADTVLCVDCAGHCAGLMASAAARSA